MVICKRSTNPRLEKCSQIRQAWRHHNSDGKTDMQARSTSFAQHVVAAWREGVTMASYAKTHGLAASNLYRWQQKLRQTQASAIDADALTRSHEKPATLESISPELVQGKFIALRIQSIEPRGSAQSAIAAQKHRCATPTMAPVMPTPTTATTTRAAPIANPIASNCSLQLAGGIRLELPTLPEPHWLAALSHYVQAAH